MKKWYWIVGAAILGVIAWLYYSKKEKRAVADPQAESGEEWAPKERGQAQSIDDLPLSCQAKYVGWAKWMHSILGTANKWADSLKARGEARGNSLDQELELEFVNLYNKNAATAQCNA